MDPALLSAILMFAGRFGIPATQTLLTNLNKPSVTLDDTIVALDKAATKSADDYLKEARIRAGIPEPPVTPPA